MWAAEGPCPWHRSRAGSQGPRPRGSLPSHSVSLPIHQSLTPAWHSGDQIHLAGSQGKHSSHREGRESSHPAQNPAPHLKTQGLRPSWPCLVDNLDWLTWQNQIFLGGSAQRDRLGVGTEKASEERDPEKVVTESGLQTISQTLSGRYYWQL